MHPLKGVLLDVDGTLIDSNDAHTQAWVNALLENGIHVSFEKVRRLIGKGADKLLPEIAGINANSPLGKAVSGARQEIFQERFLSTLRAFPRVEDLLTRIKANGLRLAVASSAKKDELASLLQICGAQTFIESHTS